MTKHNEGEDFNHWLRWKIFWADAQRLFFFPALILFSIVFFYRDTVLQERSVSNQREIEDIRRQAERHEASPGHVMSWQEVGKLSARMDNVEKALEDLKPRR